MSFYTPFTFIFVFYGRLFRYVRFISSFFQLATYSHSTFHSPIKGVVKLSSLPCSMCSSLLLTLFVALSWGHFVYVSCAQGRPIHSLGQIMCLGVFSLFFHPSLSNCPPLRSPSSYVRAYCAVVDSLSTRSLLGTDICIILKLHTSWKVNWVVCNLNI